MVAVIMTEPYYQVPSLKKIEGDFLYVAIFRRWCRLVTKYRHISRAVKGGVFKKYEAT